MLWELEALSVSTERRQYKQANTLSGGWKRTEGPRTA